MIGFFSIPKMDNIDNDFNSQLFYAISVLSMSFIGDKRYDDPKLPDNTKDLLYAIYLLSPIQNYPYVNDGDKEYSISDLFYKVFDRTKDGIDLWKKIIKFNYNNDSYKSKSNLKYETSDFINSKKKDLITGSFIKPVDTRQEKLTYFILAYDESNKYIINIANRINNILNKNGINYIKKINSVFYIYGAFIEDLVTEVVTQNQAPLVYKQTSNLSDFFMARTYNDITNNEYKDTMISIYQNVLKYISKPSQ